MCGFESPLHVIKHSGWDLKILNFQYFYTEISTIVIGLLFNIKLILFLCYIRLQFAIFRSHKNLSFQYAIFCLIFHYKYFVCRPWGLGEGRWGVWSTYSVICKFHCFTVHFDSLSFIHTNSCTFSYNYVSVF